MAKKPKVLTIADVMKVGNTIRDGKAVTIADLRASVRILQNALVSSRTATRAARREADYTRDLLREVMGKM